jgi:hypothetical protein
MSVDDPEKIPVDQARRDGETKKGIDGMRAYKGLLTDYDNR